MPRDRRLRITNELTFARVLADTILHLILARAAIGPAGESAQSPQLHSSLSALAEQGPVAVESSFASPRPFPPYVAKPVNHLQWGAATSDANHSSLIEYWYNDVIPTIANKNASLKALPSSSSPGTALSVSLLTTWSYRIDTGRQVADAKFSNNRTAYCPLIKKRDSTGLRKMVTDKAVEEALKMRVRNKLKTWSSQAWQPDAIEVVVGVFTR